MSTLSKPNIVKGILAILVVFLMTAGAFIGAAENGGIPSESEPVEVLLPTNSVAGQTNNQLDNSNEQVEEIELEVPNIEHPESEYIEPVLPEVGPDDGFEAESEIILDEGHLADLV